MGKESELVDMKILRAIKTFVYEVVITVNAFDKAAFCVSWKEFGARWTAVFRD